MEAWQGLAPIPPDEFAASVLATAPGDVEQPPAVHLFGTVLGTAADASEVLEELIARAGADPASSSIAQCPIARRSATSPSTVLPTSSTVTSSASRILRRPLPPDLIAALVDHLAGDRVPGQSRELDFTPWGGAYNRVRDDATAFVHRSELFLLKHAVVVEPRAVDAARDWLARSRALVRPLASGGVYPNFPDPELPDPARAYYGANRDRLLEIKARYDPDEVFGAF